LLSFYIFEPLANIVKPLEQWTKEEVKAWFEENEFSEYYEPFEKLSGKHLSLLSENNFISEFGPILGGAIYNSIQKLKAPVNKSHIFVFLFSHISVHSYLSTFYFKSRLAGR